MRAIFKGLLIGLALLGSMQADAWAQQLSTGKVTTAAPTYAPGTAGALSLDTSGNLRVSTTGGSGSVTPVPASGAAVTTPVTVTASSAQALASGTRVYMALANQSATASISCALAGTAVLNAAGSIILPPLSSFTWETSYVPSDAVNCIATAASVPLTIVTK